MEIILTLTNAAVAAAAAVAVPDMELEAVMEEPVVLQGVDCDVAEALVAWLEQVVMLQVAPQ